MSGESGRNEKAGLSDVLAHPPRAIFTREVPRAAAALVRRAVRRRERREEDEPAYGVVLLLAVTPLVLDRVLWPLGAGCSWRAFAWLSIQAGLTFALLLSGPWAWDRVRKLGGPIDRLLPDDTAADRYVREVDDGLAIDVRGHLLLCSGVGLVAVAAELVVSRHLSDHLGPAAYLGIGMLGFLAADAARWLLRVPYLLVRPLTEFDSLRVVLHAPSQTPAIREMGQLAAETAIRAAIGFFLFGVPLLWTVGVVKSGHSGIGALSVAPLAFSLVIVAYLVFVPQIWLSTIIAAQRDRILDELARELPEQGPAQLIGERLDKTMRLYDSIAATSTDTAEGRVIFKRTIVVLGALAPQAYALGHQLVGLPLPGGK